MVARAMMDRGTSVRQLATQLGVTEGVVRHRLKKAEAPDLDGRAEQSTSLDGYEAAVRAIQERLGDVSADRGRPAVPSVGDLPGFGAGLRVHGLAAPLARSPAPAHSNRTQGVRRESKPHTKSKDKFKQQLRTCVP